MTPPGAVARPAAARYRGAMRARTFAPALVLLVAPSLLSAQTVAYRGATLWDGTGAPPVSDATLVVREGRVVAAGRVDAPDGARVVDLTGRWIVPGLVNAHGHVSGAWAPEGVEDERARVEADLLLYARYGVTTVNSLGGEPGAAFALRDGPAPAGPARARVRVAGAVLFETFEEEGRAAVRAAAARGPDWIKIRVDDNLGTSDKMPWGAVEAVIDETHAQGLRIATHLFYLEDAKRLVRAGTDLVAHSVRDLPVDDELVRLLLDRGVCYVPTLTRELSTFVYAERPAFFDDPFFERWAKASEVERLGRPDFMEAMRTSASAAAYRRALEQASANLRILSDAGVRIAMGTDSGPAGRFPGYFEHLELEMMADAGLPPERILRSATGDAAACLGLDEVGTLEEGRWADFLVLSADPLEDVRNTRSLEAAYVSGVEVR